MEVITDSGYNRAKRACNDSGTKTFAEYHDFYLESDTLLLVDIFENYRKMCLEIYQLYPAKFLSVPQLAWQAPLTKTK